MRKTCRRCRRSKPVTSFHKATYIADGYHSYCKPCGLIINKVHRDKRNSTIAGRATIFIQNAAKSSRVRGHEMKLKVIDIMNMWTNQNHLCAYTGKTMTLGLLRSNSVSLERINSKIGYTRKNCLLVCWAMNRMKTDFGLKDFYGFCLEVVLHLSVISSDNKTMSAKRGLYANINAKQDRIKAGSKETMRKPGTKGAPTAKAFKQSAKTAKKS